MEIIDYYLACDNICKHHNISSYLSRHIFNFEIENIKKLVVEKKKKQDLEILNKLITTKCIQIEKNMDLFPQESKVLTIHLTDLKHRLFTIEELKDIMIPMIDKFNTKLQFSHYCCDRKGVLFIQIYY
tara:strand:+ start:4499 stop:4882 length:384 start_codon:yes stop_codon:yes gene_type:complete